MDAMADGSGETRYGIVDIDERRAMGGLEFVQGLVTGSLPINSMARTLGYDIVEVSEGRAVVTATPNAEHLNPEGTVHGGLAATLLDTCMGLAVRSTIERGFGSTTLEFKISFVRPLTPETGCVRAEGTVLSRGRRVGTAEGRLVDSKDRLLAHATTTCLIFEYSGS
jgi:uncharacterized protein (TIGR00369 family)